MSTYKMVVICSTFIFFSILLTTLISFFITFSVCFLLLSYVLVLCLLARCPVARIAPSTGVVRETATVQMI